MQIHPEGSAVTIEVPLVDDSGAVVEPTELRAVLFDGEDEVLVDLGTIPVTQSASQSVIIPALYSELQEDEERAPRVLSVTFDASGVTFKRSFTYVIEPLALLRTMVNSFMPYQMAEALVLDQVNFAGWAVATEPRRKAALVEAFRRLTLIPMRYWFRDIDNRKVLPELVIERDMWQEMTADDFQGLPSHFRRALRAAQLVEANEILQGDGVSEKMRQGIIREKIGESMIQFNRNSADYGVSANTMRVLSGYIHYDYRIVRG